jgi:hypothetical protein
MRAAAIVGDQGPLDMDDWATEPHYDEPHDHTVRFLNRLAPDEPVTFQTIDDAKQGRVPSTILHGTLDERWRELKRWNEQGAGITLASIKARVARKLTEARAGK